MALVGRAVWAGRAARGTPVPGGRVAAGGTPGVGRGLQTPAEGEQHTGPAKQSMGRSTKVGMFGQYTEVC